MKDIVTLGTCPYCGKAMRKGTIPGETHPHWIEEGKRAGIFRGFVPFHAVRLVLEETTFSYKKAGAYYCPDCRIVIARTESK